MKVAAAKSGLIVCVVLIIGLVIYLPTALSLFDLWTDPNKITYSHGLLLLCVAIYLSYGIWKTGPRIIALNPGYLLLLSLSMISLVWLLAKIGNIQVITQISLWLIMCLLLWIVVGFTEFKRYAYPLLLVLCVVPIWAIANEGSLQILTAVVVEQMLNFSAITVYRIHEVIHIPEGTFKIARNCSGMRQLVVAVPIGLLFSYMHNLRTFPAILYVLSALLISFFANVLRIFIVIYSGHLSNMQHYFVTEDHVTLGWAIFGVVMLIFLFLSSRYLPLKKLEKNTVSSADREKPFSRKDIILHGTKIYVLSLGLLSLSVGPVLAYTVYDYESSSVEVIASEFNVDGWHTKLYRDDWRPNYPDGEFVKYITYANESNKHVSAYLSYFIHQNQGNEAVNQLNKVYQGDKWKELKKNTINLNIHPSMKIDLSETLIMSNNGNKKLIWQWFYVKGKNTNNKLLAKLLNIWGVITGDPDITVIIAAVNVDSTEKEARLLLQEFIQSAVPEWNDKLDSILS